VSATIYREVPGYASQFFAYEALKRAMTRPGENVADLGAGPLIMAGGMAGIAGWCFSYPQDFIKSQIQAEPYDLKTPYKKNPYLLDGGFFSCWRQTVQTEGHRALWRGFGTCAARAFPANAAGFLAYELGLSMLRK
jgi:solute carrier family 25 carnitine/acylcarnitine transporter 20/29